METPKTIFKPATLGIQKSFTVSPEAFEGIEHLTPYHYGYNNQIPFLQTETVTVPSITSYFAPSTPETVSQPSKVVRYGRSAAEKHASFIKGLSTYVQRRYGLKYQSLSPEYQKDFEEEYRSIFAKKR